MTDQTVRYGVVGYGLGGSVFHAPVISAVPGAQVAVILARRPEVQAVARERYPDAMVVADPAELVDVGVDVAVVTTPNATHAPLARQLLDHGLHVVVDKPLATSVAEGEELLAVAERSGRILSCYQNRRWDADFLTLQELVAAGELGDVHRFETGYERWRPEPKTGWKETPTPGTGVLFDLGPHVIDQALQLLGRARSVAGEARIVRAGAQVVDDAFVDITHESGAVTHVFTSLVAPAPGPRYRVLGTRAGYVKWGEDPQEDALRAGRTPGGEDWGAEPPEAWGRLEIGAESRPVPSRRGDYTEFYRRMTDAVRGEGPVPVDPRDSLEVLRVIEQVQPPFAA